MKTNQLDLIIKEFFGRKCILRLANGIKVTGVMGISQPNTQTNIDEVALCCDNNINHQIPLWQIEALKIV